MITWGCYATSQLNFLRVRENRYKPINIFVDDTVVIAGLEGEVIFRKTSGVMLSIKYIQGVFLPLVMARSNVIFV